MLDTSKIAEWIKLAPRYLGALVIACGTYVLLGDSQLKSLGLATFDKSIRPWAGAALLVSASLLIAHAIAHITSRVRANVQGRRRKHALEQRLHHLSPEEQLLLAGYIHGNTKTQYLDITNGVVSGLAASKIITRASAVSVSQYDFAFNILPWALEYLQAHRELLGKFQNLDINDQRDEA